MSKDTGIETRHSRGCRTHKGERCNCSPTYRAEVYSRRERKRIRKSFENLDEARGWRSDAQGMVRRGTMKSPSRQTLTEAATAWLKGTKDGSIRNRSGDTYKPSAIRSYDEALRLKVLPDLGGARLSEIRRPDVQDLADRLIATGASPSTVRNALMPLRAIYRRAVARGDVALNPTQGIELPAIRGSRDRIVSPSEAEALLEALPKRDRALWATALYGGLRLGELRALKWEDVDLAAGVVRVERALDAKGEVIAPKSTAGRRTVPISGVLRDFLLEHRLDSEGVALCFPSLTGRPFTPGAVSRRAKRAWTVAEIDGLTLHEARHTFASLMIAAGVNAKALSTYMGHASISITLDRYGHLMPGSEDEAADLLDAYLAKATQEKARSAEILSS